MKIHLTPPLRQQFEMAAMEERYKHSLINILGSKTGCKIYHDAWVKSHDPHSDWLAANNQAMREACRNLLPSELQMMTATVDFE